jgi:crotonobetainyl-CoA:carnitine CoA-transferase CaiB-like acyl-CoA transferase
VVLDLKSPAALAVAKGLAMAADVLVENFKPGTMARLGLDAAQLQVVKPSLVYASISGFGQNQPTLAGYDQIAQGTSGMMSVNAAPDGLPTKVGVPIGDITAGMFASQAILAALVERSVTGKGRLIDVALNDSLLALFTYQAGRYFATGEVPKQEGNYHATIAPYGTFAVSDGFINVAVATDVQFARFCEAIRAPELADDPRFTSNAERQAARPALVHAIEAHLKEDTRERWLARFEQFSIPAGPILNIEEAFASPLASSREMRVKIEHPKAGWINQVGAPWKIDDESSAIRMPPPLLGQHTEEVLNEWLDR